MFKRLLKLKVKAWIVIPLLLFTWFWFFSSQSRGIASARRHVNKITPEWQTLQKENPRFRGVRFGAGTAKDGCILVTGYVLDQQDYEKAFKFIENSDPPRPVDSWLKVMPDEEIFNEMFPLDIIKQLEKDNGSDKKSE